MEIEKISFKELGDDGAYEMLDTLGGEEKKFALEIIESFRDEDLEIPSAFSVTDGAMLVRAYFQGDFYFTYPIMLSDSADISAAIDKTLRYAMLEAITPTFECVPREGLDLFFDNGYRHLVINKSQFDPSDETYSVTVRNEEMISPFYPEGEYEDITLFPLVDEDFRDYARLCRDVENNKYWGYDYREDFEADVPDEIFLKNAKKDYATHSSVALSVKKESTFLGEALISCFDFKGGADISIRLLPEYHGKGYGKKTLFALLEICRGLGLRVAYARVFNENLPSIALFSSLADGEKEKDGVTVFDFKLYES